MPKAILFIPDISGYTRFVHSTEINHQQHIITELLEILIDTNDIGLELAEVEGDALFMYTTDVYSSHEKILSLVKRMFIRFHAHLRYYDQYRICHCGACEGATGLNLKFIIHEGEVNFLKLKDFKPKPQGKEVIIAHRLLKNDISGNEYVLVSEGVKDIKNEMISSMIGSTKVELGSMDYGIDDVGLINYQYTRLGHLRSKVEDPQSLGPAHISSHPISAQTVIKMAPIDLFEILINFEHRVKWNKDVDAITYNKKEINKAGSHHICIIQGKELDFETVKAPEKPGIWSFGEKSKVPIIGYVFVYFIIYPEGDFSRLIIELHPNPTHLLGKMMMPIFKFKFKSLLSHTLISIQSYAENLPDSPGE